MKHARLFNPFVRRGAVCLAAAVFTCCRTAADGTDPTVAADALADALSRRLAGAGEMRILALVAGLQGDGVALLGPDAGHATAVRRGSVLSRTVDGVAVNVPIGSVTPRGVELASSSGGGGVLLPGSFSPLPPPAGEPGEFLLYLESSGVPIGTLMRLVSDQTGVNISVSDAAGDKTVSIFLRNVTADTAVEEICRATGLWFRREPSGRVVRIMTMGEYSENLNTFREETTEMFTLLYPNVVEVASVIYGLYPDRTLVSLGEEEFDEDAEYDLSRRFRRFRVLEDNGGSQFLSMEAPQTSGGGARSGGGNFSFSRGGALGRLTQWDQLRQRARRMRQDASSLPGAGDAGLMESAYRSGDTNLLDMVRAQTAAPGANIFVSLSRRNNMLVVRTSDTRVMDEIRAMVRRLDVPTPMVLMELKILELAIDDGYEASFTYSFNRATHSAGHDRQGDANVFADVLRSGQASVDPTFAFKVVADNVNAKVDLMQKDGKVKVLATPTLLVANNEVARIFSGKEYPLVTGWTPGSTTTGAVGGSTTTPSVPQIENKDIGTMLLVTPNINADKTVTLRLVQENSELSADAATIPVISGDGSVLEDKQVQFVESRSLAGTFVAKDGMTVMAGGLVKETDSESYWRTPVLGSIPLLGWLFRGTEKIKQRTELVVLLKPHVILTPIEGGRVSDELMKALSAHPASDGRTSMGVHSPDKAHDIGDDLRSIVK